MYINISLSIFSISAPQIPKKMIWYQLLWLKILNIKQCGILNTFWANSITITWVKMVTNPPMFWLVKEWVAKSSPLFFSNTVLSRFVTHPVLKHTLAYSDYLWTVGWSKFVHVLSNWWIDGRHKIFWLFRRVKSAVPLKCQVGFENGMKMTTYFHNYF